MPTKPIILKPGEFEDDTPSPSASGAVALAPGDYEDDSPAPLNPYANWREKRDVGRELTNISHGPGSTDAYTDPTAGPPSLLPPPKQRPMSPGEAAFSQEGNTGQYVRPRQPAPRTNFEASQQVLHPPAPVLVPSRLAGPETPAQIAQDASAHPVVPLKTLGSSTLNALLLSGKDIGQVASPTRGQEAAYAAQQDERPTGIAAGPRQAVGQIKSGLTNITEGMDPNPHAGMSPSEAMELGLPLPDYNKSTAPRGPQVFKGGTETLQGAMTLGTPAFAAGVAAAPIRAGLMYLGGVASGKAAEYAAKEAGLSQEGQQFFNVVGFFGFNSLTAAAGLRGEIGGNRTTQIQDPLTGEMKEVPVKTAAVGGRGFAAGVGKAEGGGYYGAARVGPFSVRGQWGGKPVETGPIIQGERAAGPVAGRLTAESQDPTVNLGRPVAPPDGATVQANAQQQTVTEVAARAADTRQQAQQVAGMAPPPPPPPKPGEAGSGVAPLPAGMEDGHLSPQTVSYAARAVKMLPPALQPQAIRLAIGKLADWMFKSKTVVGPDGKAVNVDSPKAAQAEAIKIINDAVDQETEAGETQAKAQEDARKQAKKTAKEREKDQETVTQERQDAIKETTAPTAQVPDNPLTQAIRAALQKHPEPATEKSLDKLVGTFPVVPAATRKALVQEEITRRGNLQEDQGQANLTGQAPAAGESRDELQKWSEALLADDHPFMLVPAGSTFKPALSTDNKAAFTKTPVKNSPVPELNGDYYHPKTIKNSEIRAAAESNDPRAALAEIEKKWRQENPTELAPGEFEEETPAAETKPAVAETKPRLTEEEEGAVYKQVVDKLLAEGVNPDDTEAWGTAYAKELDRIAEERDKKPVIKSPAAANEITAEVTKEKPVTPQVAPIKGVTPLGAKPAKPAGVEVGKTPVIKSPPAGTGEKADIPNKVAPAPLTAKHVAYLTGSHNANVLEAAQRRGDIGLMVTPLRPDYLQHAAQYPVIAIDNGVFSKTTPFNAEKFEALIDKAAADPAIKAKVRFVVAPDVVGDAQGTLDKFDAWADKIHAKGLPVAFAAQNGIEFMADKIPWAKMDVLFIGGSTEWKIGQHTDKFKAGGKWEPNPLYQPGAQKAWINLFREAEKQGVPVHMGRVNSALRLEIAEYGLGASTVDGTFLAFGPDKNQPQMEKWLDRQNGTGTGTEKVKQDDTMPPTLAARPEEPDEAPIFKAGDKVTFTDFAGKEREGTILEAQPKRAIIKASNGDRIPVPLDRIKAAEKPSAEEPSEPIVPTEEKPAVIEAKQEGETPAPTVNNLVDTLYRKIAAGESLGNVTELNKIAESVLGAGRTSGAWTPKDVFDAMEAAVNRHLIEQGARLLAMDPKAGLTELRELMGRLTSQGVRTEEQIKLQQFSTPPTESYVAALAAALKPNDVALEPSAGNGGLALWPKSIGATVHVNEISPRRREMLRAAGFGDASAHDGEIVNALLDQNIQPTVILMNPPFSASDQKSHEAKNRSLYGFNHVDSALQRLQKGGRLVAILGGGQANEPNGGASLLGGASGKWFEKLAKQYNVRANIRISGREYQKYGTSFATRIIVIDKDGPTKSLADVVQGNFDTLEDAYDALKGVAESRPEIAAAGPRSQGSLGQGESGTGLASGGNSGVSVRGEPRGTGLQDGEGTGSAGHGLRGDGRTAPANRPSGGNQPTALHPVQPEPAGHPAPGPGAIAGGSHPDVHGERPNEPPIAGLEAGATTGIDLERVENEATPEEEDSAAFVGYNPTIKGPAHPGAIVESKTMATVPSPEITYKPALASPLESGRLSAVQLEAVALAGAQNDIILPSGARASMLIGDGTGVGKGREGAAIIHDNWAKGRRRLMWVTKSWDLLPAAIVDFKNIGSELAHKVIGLQDFDAKDVLDHEGVIVTTYGLMRSADKKGNTRFAQIDRWLRGKDEGDGAYMLFDESHNLKNAVVGQGGQASQVGVGTKDLIDKMPKLRLTSMSATAASDVMNLGYLADRLGLCGAGTAFPTGFNQFAAAISGGGMSALEMIARELKAQGKYVSRTLSFKGVTYDTVHATLTPDQRAVYRSATRAWRAVVQRAEASITNSTNGGSWQKSRFMSLFYGAQLRFFNVLLTSLKIPAMIERAQQDLKDGKSVIITLINTNEAAQNREKTKAAAAKADDPDEIPEYDFGPSEMLIDLVREHYPVQQFQDDVDSNGKPIKTPVFTTDSEGHQTPVLNPQAVAERNALMAELKRDLNMPGNPLDILIQALGGPKKVAELTGRKEYFDEAKQQFVPRGGKDVPRKKINQVEMQRFQDGEKRVAILSSAADTGISLHSDNNAKNKQKRSQYTLQPGWSADKAMQMLGRGHRTNQAHAPELHMVESDMAGEKRFIATITRRLGSLNAIARGQKTAGAGASAEAMDKVNFESEQGRQATDMFYRRLLQNMEIPGAAAADGTPLRGMRILDDLSVLKDDALNGKTVPVADRTNVTKLLNRLMALDPDLQQPVYDYFYDLFNAIVTQAEADGTLDTGVRTLPGETFAIKENRTVANDPRTKAATDYYKVEAKSATHRVSPEEFDKRIKGKPGEPDPLVMRNKKTGQLLIARAARPIVHADGTSTLAAHISTPAAGAWTKVPQNDIASRFESVTEHAKGEVTKAEDAVSRAERDLESAKRYATNIPELDERIKTAEDAYRLAVGYNRDYRERELQSLRRRRQDADANVIREKEEQTRLEAAIEKAKLDLEAAKDKENNVDDLTRDEWEKQYNGAPSHRTQEFHLIGGAVMRWWNPIHEAVRGAMRIFTTVDSETGKRVVGIEIDPAQISPLLARLAGGGTTVTLDQLRSDVLQNGTEYTLETGIRVTRGRIGGDTVIRFHPSSDAVATNLKKLGIVYERGIQPVYYLPEAKYTGDRDQYNKDWELSQKILKAVLKEYPPASDAPVAAAPAQANRVPRGSATFSMLGTAALDEPAKVAAAYAVKAGKATWKEAIEAAKATGKSAKVIGREVVGWMYPTALASRDALDIMGKAIGEPAMRTFEAGQLMHGINKMFESMPEEWTNFIDAKENGRDQGNPDLQHAQELMDSILEAQRERENEAVNLGRNPDVDMERFTEDIEDGLSNKELGERYGISWQQARVWRRQIANGEEVKQDRIELTNKPDYFPHRWEVGPQGEDPLTEQDQIQRIGGIGRRPFEGSKAFMKQQTWGYRDAIEAGAKPIGSPVKMLMRRLQEGAKFVAARYAWHNLKESGMALFLKRGRVKPEGFSFVEDKSANVWRMIESTELTDQGQNRRYPVEAGRWIVQDDAARLLNNYLSKDFIRGSEGGRALVKIKNFTTEARLSWSAFHWGYITAETFRAALQVGIDKLYNQGLRDLDSKAAMEGMADIGRTMIAPYTAIKMGGQLIQYARTPQEFLASPEGQKFNERYPDAYHLMQLLHQGGLRWDLADTFRASFGDHAIDAWKAGELGKAMGKTLPWLAHMVARPLFEHYIPRAKWAFAVQNLSAKLAQYSEALADGTKTEVELAREIAEMSDNFFGEVNWDSLFLDNSIRTALQLTFRSATWKMGSWRGALQAGKETFTSQAFDDHMIDRMEDQARRWDWARKYTTRLPQLGTNAAALLSMALFVGITGSILSKLASKKWPWEWAKEAKNNRNYLANTAMEAMHFRTGKTDLHGEPIRFSFPTGLKDYEHGFEHPGRYIKGSESDILSNAWDSLANEDAFGNYVYDPNDPIYSKIGAGLLYNIKGDLLPMSVSNWNRTYGSQDLAGKASRATGMIGGAPKWLDRSAALEEAVSLQRHQAHTPEQMQEWEYARSAPPTRQAMLKAHREKDMEYLEKLVTKMSYTDAMKVYEKATPEERAELKHMIRTKQINAIKAGRQR